MATHKKSSKNVWTEIVSLSLFGVSVFLTAALFSYHPGDPSWFAGSVKPVVNACGPVGALLSALFLQSFGLGAFLVPASLFFLAVAMHYKEGALRFSGILIGMTAATLGATVFLSLQWPSVTYAGSELLTGGVLGAWIAHFLVQWLNPWGATIVSALVTLLCIAAATPVTIARFSVWLGGRLSVITWRLAKVMVGYCVYLLGLGAVRFAGWVGQASQQVAVFAVAQAKQGWESLAAYQAERREKRELREVASEVVSSGPASGAIAAGSPALAFEGEMLDLELSVDAQEEPLIADATLAEPGEGHEEPVRKRKVTMRTHAFGNWKLPSVEFLNPAPTVESTYDRKRLLENSVILKQKLADFGIDGDVTAVRPGPVITLYEFKPGPGIKVSKIAALADDLSMALSAKSVRILAPLPGKSVVGIEIPSDQRETVYFREFLENPEFKETDKYIPVVMGKDISGKTVYSDLARMPHLLCAGQTGSGKSVFMNTLICSLFYRFTPDELRMILIDPKFIEFRAYSDIPHLLLPVVDNPKEASIALKWAVREMERRYRLLAMMGVRNLESYNQKVEDMGPAVVADLLNEAEQQSDSLARMVGGDWRAAFENDENGLPRIGKLPTIVIIIDELADLMMVARKDVEISIARIAQKARAAGIHLVIATQRPSTDVVTGIIKANLPSRVSFQLASFVDSKTILDRAGAEKLLGRGDMLFIPPGSSQLVRLHGAYLEDEEIEKITRFLKSQGKPVYRGEILVDDEEEEQEGSDSGEADDELFSQAVDLVKRSGHASASFLQRHLKVGYNRAARMIETMEERGIVGPADGARPREVLIR